MYNKQTIHFFFFLWTTHYTPSLHSLSPDTSKLFWVMSHLMCLDVTTKQSQSCTATGNTINNMPSSNVYSHSTKNYISCHNYHLTSILLNWKHKTTKRLTLVLSPGFIWTWSLLWLVFKSVTEPETLAPGPWDTRMWTCGEPACELASLGLETWHEIPVLW